MMSDDHTSMGRRRMLQLAGAGAVAATAGCSALNGSNGAEPQLETLRSEFGDYDGDMMTAKEDGYFPFGPLTPGVGWYFIDEAAATDAVENGFDLTTPQGLLYDSSGTLGGVAYLAPAEEVEANPDLFTEGEDADESWTTYPASTNVLANGNGQRDNPLEMSLEELLTPTNWVEFRPPNPELNPGQRLEAEWGLPAGAERSGNTEERIVDFASTSADLRLLHVWAFVDNPEGTFNLTNPEFAQPSMGGGGNSSETEN